MLMLMRRLLHLHLLRRPLPLLWDSVSIVVVVNVVPGPAQLLVLFGILLRPFRPVGQRRDGRARWAEGVGRVKVSPGPAFVGGRGGRRRGLAVGLDVEGAVVVFVIVVGGGGAGGGCRGGCWC